MKTKVLGAVLVLVCIGIAGTVLWPARNPALPPAPPARHYACGRASAPVTVDGDIDKAVWQAAAWTEDFVDIEGDLKPKPQWRTRAKMLWDAENLYIAAQIEEPQVWATLTERDSVIFHDNDFEVFLNPSCDTKNYYELELNALNTVWDLLLRKPYREGGTGENSFHFAGLKTAVRVRGSLNNAADIDQGWDVEVAIPWAALTAHTSNPSAPKTGDVWKVNFSRVEWDTTVVEGKSVKVPNRPEHNWVWSPMGLIDMHLPGRWGTVEFK